MTDCQLNAVCERLEERCCLDEPPAAKSPANTGAKLWERVRNRLLRQKVRRRHYFLMVRDLREEGGGVSGRDVLFIGQVVDGVGTVIVRFWEGIRTRRGVLSSFFIHYDVMM